MKKWLILATLGVAVIFWTLPAAAQLDLLISPIRVEHQVAAGGSETNIIQVRNESSKPERVKVSLEDWGMDAKGNLNYSRPGKSPNSCAPWIQVNPTDFRLDPGTREVRYTITVPPGAKPGSYWAAIIFEAMPLQEGPPKGRKLGVRGRVGAIIYETLGNPEIKASIKDFQVDARKTEPVFLLTMANKGTGFYRLRKSFITVKNAQGKEAAKMEVPEVPLLPGGIRELELKPGKALPKGEYTAEAVIDMGKRDFLGRKINFTVGGK